MSSSFLDVLRILSYYYLYMVYPKNVHPYYGFKYLDKNQDVEISPEDIQRYKRIYSEEFKKRKSKNKVN